MNRWARAAELRERAARLRGDAAEMIKACGGEEPVQATWLKLGAAFLELRALVWAWPR